jgi:hypothetical protein
MASGGDLWVKDRFQPLVVPLHKRTLSCGYSCILCPFCLRFEATEMAIKAHVGDEHCKMKIADYQVSQRRAGDRAHFHKTFPAARGTKATDRSIKEVLNMYCALARTDIGLGGSMVFHVLRLLCPETDVDVLYCTFCGMRLTIDLCQRHVTNTHVFWSPRFCTTRKHYI